MAYPADFKMIIRDSIISELFSKPILNTYNEISKAMYDIAKETDEFNRKLIYRIYLNGKNHFSCEYTPETRYFYNTHLTQSTLLELTYNQKKFFIEKTKIADSYREDREFFKTVLTKILMELPGLHDIFKVFPKEIQDLIPFKCNISDATLSDIEINLLKKEHIQFLEDVKNRLTLNLLMKDINYE